MYYEIIFPNGENIEVNLKSDVIINYTLEQNSYYLAETNNITITGYAYDLILKYERNLDIREFIFRISKTKNTPFFFESGFYIYDCSICLDTCEIDITLKSRDLFNSLFEDSKEYNVLSTTNAQIQRYNANTLDPNTNANINIDNFMKLEGVVLWLAQQEYSNIVGVVSDFFTSPVNVLTGVGVNKYKDLYIIQKTDIVFHNSVNNATVLNLSFIKLMNDLRDMFNIVWWVEGLNVRIEHISFLYLNSDITDLQQKEVINMPNCYSYNVKAVNTGVKLKYQEGVYLLKDKLDYIDVFNRPVKGNGKYKDIKLEDICNDVRFMLDTDFDKKTDGYCFVRLVQNGLNLDIEISGGAFPIQNTSLKPSELLYNFHSVVTKSLPTTPITLVHYTPSSIMKTQNEIILVSDLNFNKSKKIMRVKTSLGIGVLSSYSYNLNNCRLTLNALIN